MSTPVSSPRRHLIRRAAVATLVCLSALVAQGAASPALASSTPTAQETADAGDAPRAVFGVQPANADGGVDDRAFLQYGLPPMSTVFDYVGVLNYGDEALTLDMYATDAFSGDTGDFSLLPGSEPPRDAGSWINVGDSTAEVTVPPANGDGPGKVVLPVTIAVPENATPGDHTAGILAVLRTLGENPEGQNVQLEQRVAARVYLRVDGDLAPGLTISDISGSYRASDLPWQAGRIDLSYRVTNSGNVRMGVQPAVTVSGPFGVDERRLEAPSLPELLPEGSYLVEQTVDDVWPLIAYDASIRLEAVAAPGAQAPDIQATTASTRIWALPWVAILLLVVLIGIVTLLVVRRSRRGRPTGDRPGGRSGGPTATATDRAAAAPVSARP